MKRLVSLTVSFLLTISCLSVSFSVFAEGLEKSRIESFAEKCVEIANEYDEGKVFELVDETTPEDDDLQFQTARLFVKCSSYFNKMGAEEKVSGFDAWHLLQFSSPEEAKKAYNYYLKQKNIECVEPDAPMKAEMESEMEASKKDIQYLTKEEFLNDYSRQVMGFDQVLPYISNNHIQTAELRVAVLDTGIDYNHEIFEGRLFRTYFNSTGAGTENDEYDTEVADGHGTAVTGCIVANTPSTVKVGCYKALDNNKHEEAPELVPSWVVSALLQAYSDGCIAVNMSFTAPVTLDVFKDALKTLYNSGVALFAGAGNSFAHDPYGVRGHSVLCTNEYVYTVGGSNNKNEISRVTNTASWVRFLAPCDDLGVAAPDNKYRSWIGTSFSSPLAVAEYVLLRSINSEYSNEKMIDLMSYTCQQVRGFRGVPRYKQNESWSGANWYGAGILDAVGAFCEIMNIDRSEKVSFSLENEGLYHTGDELILTAEPDSTIYYTLDSAFPLQNEWIEYTQPILIDHVTEVNAIAVGNKPFRSQNAYSYFRGFDVGTDDMFEITNEGMITSYTGEYKYLEIPETIKGITVKSIKCGLFSYYAYPRIEGMIALKLPDTIEYIDENEDAQFSGNETIEFFYAKNLKRINYGMFQNCKSLHECYVPNLQYISEIAFEGVIAMRYFSCPNVTHIGSRAFSGCSSLFGLNLSGLKEFDEILFDLGTHCEILDLSNLEQGLGNDYFGDVAWVHYNGGSTFLQNLFLPKVKIIYDGDFHYLDAGRIEFSNLEELYSLPISTSSHNNSTCWLVLPSTLKVISPYGEFNQAYLSKNKVERIFYGTRGSYAEQWANENGFKFIELNQDSAVITDVRERCNKYTRTLFFDSMGFNKEYQWYGSYDNSTDNGVQLEGATKELLNLKDYREYPYYYCVCTSTDRDEAENFEHQELIYSRVCENIDYADADYTQYNSAVEQANALDRTLYKDLTVLDEALAKDVSDLPSSMQADVDEATQAILDAIDALEYRDADYSAYNAAVEKANDLDRSLYKDLTALDEVLAVDVSGKNITEQDIVDSQTQAILDAIDALELKPMEYKIIEGANGEYEQGSKKDLIIVSDAEFDKFESVEIDGETVGANNYNAGTGSTRITLKSSYLDNLSLGEHSISIISSDGRASTTFTVKQVSESTTESTTEPQSEPESTTEKSNETTAENVTESSNQNENTTGNHYVPDYEKSPRTGNGKTSITVAVFSLMLSSGCVLYVLKRKE